MNTIEEIAEYCGEENSFGALLISGEWGCGKTYLLEHDLPERLGEAYVILRMSLFGETSVEAVRKKVKKTYFNTLLTVMQEEHRENQRAAASSSAGTGMSGASSSAGTEMSGASSSAGTEMSAASSSAGTATADTETTEDSPAINIRSSANDWIGKSEGLTPVEKIFTRDPSEYIRLEPTIAGRRVILCFDDLERCHLSVAEILGCINEYCENLHIKTIIVANEDKIRDWQKNKTKNQEDGKMDFLAYSEIKEKIIARTVKMATNYDIVVSNILANYRTHQEGYVDFLWNSKPYVLSLLSDCEIRNIRSLRCGFQDFEKIYRLCREEEVADSEILKYFRSFVLFVILAKGGQIGKSRLYGYGLNRLAQKYPGHYTERYMPLGLKDWVMGGPWPEEEMRQEIRRNAELLLATAEPQHRIRSMELMEMDDELLQAGWDKYLQLAYHGELNLEEYVLLLKNQISAREYDFTWPVAPNLALVSRGLEEAFDRICLHEEEKVQLRDRLDETMIRRLTEEEKGIYTRITRFFDSKAYLFGLNRNRILRALTTRDLEEIFKCVRYETNLFDSELAESAAAWYGEMRNNQQRKIFIDYLVKILQNCLQNRYAEDEATVRGLNLLVERIREIRIREEMLPLRRVTTDYFLTQLEAITDKR